MEEINPVLLIFLMINTAAVVYWVMKGQWKHNEMMNGNINKDQEDSIVKKEVDKDERGKDSLV